MTNNPKNSDDHILSLMQNNDVRAVNILYDLYYDTVIKIAFKIINDNEAAKDIVQELFLNIWIKRHQLSIKNPIAPYLAKSVINRCLNYLRDSPRDQSIPSHFINTVEKNSGEELLEHRDLEHLIQLTINSLPPKCKLIFNLSRSEEMSYKEIASHLGISTKAVEKQITKALKYLRHHLKLYLSVSLYFVMV